MLLLLSRLVNLDVMLFGGKKHTQKNVKSLKIDRWLDWFDHEVIEFHYIISDASPYIFIALSHIYNRKIYSEYCFIDVIFVNDARDSYKIYIIWWTQQHSVWQTSNNTHCCPFSAFNEILIWIYSMSMKIMYLLEFCYSFQKCFLCSTLFAVYCCMDYWQQTFIHYL